MNGLDAGMLAAELPGFLAGDWLIGYFVFGAIAGAIAVALVFVKRVLPIAAFAYPVTRVRVMAGRMIRDRKLRELAESYNYRDVIAAFEGTGYEQYVAGKEEIEDIEQGLTLNLADDYNRIVKMSPRKAGEFFKIVSRRYEVKNAKNILAAKATGEEVGELYPCQLSDALLQKLKDAESVQEAVELLKMTRLKHAVEEIPQDAGVEQIQKALDKFLFEKLFDRNRISLAVKKAGVMKDETHLMRIFGYYVDILNIKTALRCIAGGLGEKETKEMLFDNYFFLPEKQARAMVESSDVPGAINALDGTPYFETLNEASRDFKKEEGLYKIEKSLDSFYAGTVKSAYLQQPFGLTPISCYLLMKENEISTLKAILNGIEEGIPKEKIKELFIGA